MTSGMNSDTPPGPAEFDSIIHAPARLQIVALLSVVESADFTFLVNQTRLTRGNMSSHLSKLEEAGYINVKKEFVDRIPRTLIRLSKKGKVAFAQYKKDMKRLLDG